MGFKYDKHNKYHRLGRSAVITAVSLLVFVWVWWIASVIVQRHLDLNSSPLANPADAFAALFDLMRNGDPIEHRSMWSWIWSSLQKFFKGFVLAVVVALPVGPNKDRGPQVKKVCSAGCIGCMLCTRQCEFDAIHVENNVAHVDQEKCIGCTICAQKCPKKVISVIENANK